MVEYTLPLAKSLSLKETAKSAPPDPDGEKDQELLNKIKGFITEAKEVLQGKGAHGTQQG